MRLDTSILDRHERIALQFSGGKDSLALWGLMRPHLDRVVVYHVDTGDQLPETRELVSRVEAESPRFVRIRSDSIGFRLREGIVSDLVPATAGDMGLLYGMSEVKMCGRLYCCFNNQMLPMHNRMEADEVTLVIRGTKRADAKRLPHQGGDTGAGYELWLPLLDWSDAQVFGYLREQGLPVHTAYGSIKHSLPDCASCTAWWSDQRAAYLREHAPDAYALYRAGMQIIADEITPLLRDLQMERGS